MECTDMERRILDMWPKFEDGSYVMFEDDYEFDANEVERRSWTAVNLAREVGRVGLDGFYEGVYTGFNPSERVKRPAPKVLDADGVEIRPEIRSIQSRMFGDYASSFRASSRPRNA